MSAIQTAADIFTYIYNKVKRKSAQKTSGQETSAQESVGDICPGDCRRQLPWTETTAQDIVGLESYQAINS